MMKIIKTSEDRKVLILSSAKLGEAVARFLERLGAIVTVNNDEPFDGNPAVRSLLEEGIKVTCGSHPLELLDKSSELTIKNLGIRYDNPMVAHTIEKNIPVIIKVELVYMILGAPIIGITGSNDKTTATTMTAETFSNDGKSGLLSGNIGFPASEVVQIATGKDALVMELFSFQLTGADTFHLHIAVITNLMPTHIDYHGTSEECVVVKWDIQKNMIADDFAALNFNQDLIKELAQKTVAKVVPLPITEKVDGAHLGGDTLCFKGETIMKVSEIGVSGSHNIESALVAITVAKSSGITNDAIKEILTHLGGVKHCLQVPDEINGVRPYNDLKSTNILATQKTFSGSENSKATLIAGGPNRGNESDELVPDIIGVKLMVIPGESAPHVKHTADKTNAPYIDAKDAADTAHITCDKAGASGVVFLSPTNASWDMYRSFEVRDDELIVAFEVTKGG